MPIMPIVGPGLSPIDLALAQGSWARNGPSSGNPFYGSPSCLLGCIKVTTKILKSFYLAIGYVSILQTWTFHYKLIQELAQILTLNVVEFKRWSLDRRWLSILTVWKSLNYVRFFFLFNLLGLVCATRWLCHGEESCVQTPSMGNQIIPIKEN